MEYSLCRELNMNCRRVLHTVLEFLSVSRVPSFNRPFIIVDLSPVRIYNVVPTISMHSLKSKLACNLCSFHIYGATTINVHNLTVKFTHITNYTEKWFFLP